MDTERKKQQSRKDHSSSSSANARAEKVKELFDVWLQDTSGYDEQAWPQIKKALNDNHSKSHNLFDE